MVSISEKALLKAEQLEQHTWREHEIDRNTCFAYQTRRPAILGQFELYQIHLSLSRERERIPDFVQTLEIPKMVNLNWHWSGYKTPLIWTRNCVQPFATLIGNLRRKKNVCTFSKRSK